jgi:hypothetical protein
MSFLLTVMCMCMMLCHVIGSYQAVNHPTFQALVDQMQLCSKVIHERNYIQKVLDLGLVNPLRDLEAVWKAYRQHCDRHLRGSVAVATPMPLEIAATQPNSVAALHSIRNVGVNSQPNTEVWKQEAITAASARVTKINSNAHGSIASMFHEDNLSEEAHLQIVQANARAANEQ